MSKVKRPYISKATREQVYSKYNGHCAYCGKEITYKEMQIDHLIPFRKAVHKQESSEIINSIENLFPACALCNWCKKSKSIEAFRREIKHKFKIVEKTAAYRILLKYGLITESLDKQIIFYFEQFK